MFQDSQLLTRLKGSTPALLCLLALAFCQVLFVWHWASFALLLRDPTLEQVARPEVIAGLNRLVLAAILINTVVMCWLWPRRHQPEPWPRVSLLVALVQGITFAAMGIVYGPLTSPINTALVSALALGLALVGWRPALISFVVAIIMLVVNDWLVLGGIVPYAPALVPGTFQDGQPVAWWRAWQDAMFFTAMGFGLVLMMWLFSRLDRQRQLLEELSQTDGLTGLSNRRHFMARLAVEQRRRERYGQSFSVVLCDADHFKRVNDSYGHHAGDEVLRHVGHLLSAGLRVPGDVAARLGGEEFALLLTDCSGNEARTVCERLRRQLAAHEFQVDGHRFHVTMSMGLVECCSGTEEEVLKTADLNLYRAKAEGRNQVVMSVQGGVPC